MHNKYKFILSKDGGKTWEELTISEYISLQHAILLKPSLEDKIIIKEVDKDLKDIFYTNR